MSGRDSNGAFKDFVSKVLLDFVAWTLLIFVLLIERCIGNPRCFLDFVSFSEGTKMAVFTTW